MNTNFALMRARPRPISSPNGHYNTGRSAPNNWGLTRELPLATMSMMNTYSYLYHYLQQFCAVQQRFMHEAAAAAAALATAPAVTTSA